MIGLGLHDTEVGYRDSDFQLTIHWTYSYHWT